MNDERSEADVASEPAPPLTFPGWLMVKLVLAYQVGISPFLGNNCRFYPTCSEYFILSVKKYGAVRGSCRGIARICRCHPFHPGGVDLP
jgi:putative membrane protein insertion efficiency factor